MLGRSYHAGFERLNSSGSRKQWKTDHELVGRVPGRVGTEGSREGVKWASLCEPMAVSHHMLHNTCTSC